MKINPCVAFFCLLACSLAVQSVFSQSLYKDARTLANILQQSQSPKVADSLWFRLSHSVPFVISQEFINEESYDTLHTVGETDYLVMNKGEYPDELIVYRRSLPDSILFSTTIKYDFCIMRLRHEGQKDKLTLLAPSGETMAIFSGPALIDSNIVISNRSPGNIRFYDSNDFRFGSDCFHPAKFTNYSKELKEGEPYVFPSLPNGDTLLVKSDGKLLLKVYKDPARDKFVFLFSLDSIYTEVDGDDFLLEHRDSMEAPIAPFSLFWSNNFFAEYNGISALAIPERGTFILQKDEKHKKYELEIKTNKEVIGVYFDRRKLDPDHISIEKANRSLSLSQRCKYHFDQITFYNGSRLLKTFDLKRAKLVYDISFNQQTNNIDFSILRDIHPYDTEYSSFRKKCLNPSEYPLGFIFMLRRFDYHCQYASFLEDQLIPDRSDTEIEQTDEEGFTFEIREIHQNTDTVYQIRQSGLASIPLHYMPLKDNTLYMIRMDTTLAKKQLKGLDFTDLAFHLGYEDAEGEPLLWYPALDPMIEVFVKDSVAHIYYAPTTVTEQFSVPLFQNDSLPVLLGSHAQLKQADLQSPYLWGDISDKYRNNPFLAKYLKDDLAHTRFDQVPGLPNVQLREKISDQLETYFAWQKIVFDNERLQTETQVPYDELVNTYRTRIPTASDKLQVASEQFNNESQKLHRGLNAADLAAGLSDFIVERAQEELNLTFLNRLRDRVQRDSEFIVLFPQTVKMMADFKIEQYRTLLDFAKNAFVLDLRNLGVTFPRLFSQLSKYQRLQNDPKVYNLFLLYDIANKVYEGTPVEKVLLHIHNRLQERRTGLDESINKDLGKKLLHDNPTRQQLSDFILNYEKALEHYYDQKKILDKSFMTNWKRLSDEMERDGVDGGTQTQMKTLKMGEDSLKNAGLPRFSQYRFASDNLLGDPGYEYLKNYLEFNRFRDFFSQKPDSSRTISLGLAQADVLLSEERSAGIEAYMREMEEKISTIQSLRDDLESQRANAVNSLSGYMPLLQKYKSLMVRRACLELALKTELTYHGQTDRHDIESLNYLSGVLRTPQKFDLYNWGKLDDFGRSLAHFSSEGSKVSPLSGDPSALHFSNGKQLSLFEGYQLLSVVSSDAAEIEAEISIAEAFLNNMASTMRDHFPTIAASRSPDAIQKDTVLYRRFLYSRQMTDAAVVLDYHGLLQHMDEVLTTEFLDSLLNGKELNINLDKQAMLSYETQAASQIIKPVVLTGNQFLDYYDQTIPFEPYPERNKPLVSHNAGLAQEVESMRASIAALQRIGMDYRRFLGKVKSDSTAAPLAALRQAAQFDTLVSMTLLWMYAFRNDAAPGDSTIIVRDTIVIHKKVLLKSGGDMTYDTSWILPRIKGANQWLTLQQFNEIMEDTLQRKTFLGLLFQRLSAMEGGMNYNTSNLALLATKFMNTVYEIDDARAILQYKKEHNNLLGFEDYYPFIRSTVDMLNVVLETPLGPGDQPLTGRFSALSDLPDISNESLSLFENIFAENYGSAIRNVVQLLSITWGLREKDKRAASSLDGKKSTPLKGRAHATISGNATRRGNEKIKSAVLTYGTFMANMVEAQTPDQVKAAISAVAVPPGSSSLKRNARLNVGVNGYFGLGFHQETLTADSLSGYSRRSPAFGLSVPVGIAISMGQLRIGKKEQSFSLFLPVLDLGAVTTYRLNQKEVPSELPKLTFGNIISPGAYLLWNISRSPFTIGGGAQFGPQLRQVTVDGNKTTSSAWRYGVTVAIDVPIFNLYTQQEKEMRRRKR